MSNTLISTVGASLLGNLRVDERLRELFEKGKVDEISDYLLTLDEDPESYRGYGAEINSIVSIIKKGYISEMKNLYFLISDTLDGKKIGGILKNYFEKSEFKFEHVEIKVNEKLDDSKPYDFKIYGLKNLIKNMASIIRQHYGSVIINATGGYKAQIAFALALGQGLKVPVYYRFERFPEVIELEPLPLNLDPNLYFLCRDLFEDLQDDIKNYNEYDSMYKSLSREARIFFDITKIDNEKYISISPMGQIYIESIKNEFYHLKDKIKLKKREQELLFLSSDSEGHSKELINKYNLKKIFEDFEYIEKIRVLRYSLHEKSTKAKVKIRGNNIIIILQTRQGILHLEAETTANNENELEIIKLKLEEYLNNKF
ncbi:putative CRISPR-associated protein [Marinitoga litoralis]|uniref:putative CRISPR-associated protein n=1 Tax=Marinitoga litoralis TaxID=570855 RepID=UPI00196200F1|nr:putative CRISPR-associated protein [Marinitoga litoralis]MBM7559257.1 putative CRISPR-associated protein (TIGR02619 family) [Marinitoga litoralis]